MDINNGNQFCSRTKHNLKHNQNAFNIQQEKMKIRTVLKETGNCKRNLNTLD